MRTTGLQVAGALLRKDFHESRWLISGLALSLAASHLIRPESGANRYLTALIEYIPPMLAVLWGATNGDRQNRNRLFEQTHLPISAFNLWFVSACFPVVLMMVTARLSQTYALITGADCVVFSRLMLDLPALFTLSCFISSVSSSRTGVVAGVLIIIVAPSILQPFDLQSVFLWGVFVGASLAMLLSLVLRGIAPADIRLKLCFAVMVIMVAVPSVFQIRESIQGRYEVQFTPHDYLPFDKAITISIMKTGKAASSIAEYRNARTGEVCKRSFMTEWHVAWIDANGDVCVLESVPGKRSSRIAWWRVKTNSYQPLFNLPLRPDFDSLCVGGHFASVDPSGRYMLVRMPGLKNSSMDLWLFDLKLKTGRVIFQNAAHLNVGGARWAADRARIPSYRSRVIEVNASAGTVRHSGRSGGSG